MVFPTSDSLAKKLVARSPQVTRLLSQTVTVCGPAKIRFFAVSRPTFKDNRILEKCYASESDYEDLHLFEFSHHFETVDTYLSRHCVHKVRIFFQTLDCFVNFLFFHDICYKFFNKDIFEMSLWYLRNLLNNSIILF